MTPTEARDRVADLAPRKPADALKLARSITDPWFRAQALSFVAGHEAEEAVLPVAREAFNAAAESSEPYKSLAVSAWPLGALVKRHREKTAQSELARLLARLDEVEPESSRSEALFMLFQASFDLGPAFRDKMIRSLLALARGEAHWRTKAKKRIANGSWAVPREFV